MIWLIDESLYLKLWVFFSFCYPVVKYTAGEIRKMEESIRIRRSKESVELVELVSAFNVHSIINSISINALVLINVCFDLQTI